MSTSPFNLAASLQGARQASSSINALGRATSQSYAKNGAEGDKSDAASLRMKALAAMGNAIERNQDDILEANTLDLEISRDMAIPDLVVDWLKLTPERVQNVVNIFQRLALTGTNYTTGGLSHDGATHYHVCPVGTVGFIYEAFPDLGAIAAALCICTGNALVLKGGDEATRTNRIIADLLQEALTKVGLPGELILPIASESVSRQDISQSSEIDLIITHGRPSLVEQVVKRASVPVIPSRMGNCYLYWSACGSLDTVYQMTVDSHSGTPDAVNRIEKILVHESLSPNAVIRLWNRLQESGFEVVADSAIAALNSTDTAAQSPEVASDEWSRAYLKKKVALRQVASNEAAVQWINAHSSGHADGIATTDYAESRQFMNRCRSASVYINASPRFERNARRTGAIALGASDYKGTTGGLISMDTLQVRQRIFYGQ